MNGLKVQIANVLALFQMNTFKFLEESMGILRNSWELMGCAQSQIRRSIQQIKD